MENNDLFDYYENKELFIEPEFITRFAYYTRKSNKKLRLIKTIGWINSMCHKFKDKNIEEIFIMIKSQASKYEVHLLVSDESIIKILEEYKKNNIIENDIIVGNKTEDKLYWKKYLHFKWKEEQLKVMFNNDIEKIKEYKKEVIGRYSRLKCSKNKTKLILDIIESNPEITKKELLKVLNGKVGLKKINSVLKGLKPLKKGISNNSINIKKVLDNTFNSEVNLKKENKTISYNILASHLNISYPSVQRFFSENLEYKVKLKEYNSLVNKNNSRLKKLNTTRSFFIPYNDI